MRSTLWWTEGIESLLHKRVFLSLWMALGAGVLQASADIVHIPEGSYEGLIVEETSERVRLDTGTKTLTFYHPEIESIERGPIAVGGMRRFPFGIDRSYGFFGKVNYSLSFELQEPGPDLEGWKPWIKALLIYNNKTDQSIHTAIAVAFFDEKDQLLSADAYPHLTEGVTKPGTTMNVNLDFPLAGYSVEDISYFLVTFHEGLKPLLPNSMEEARRRALSE